MIGLGICSRFSGDIIDGVTGSHPVYNIQIRALVLRFEPNDTI